MGDEARITSGKLIRTARKRMGLSQVEVASLADVSRRTVQHAESGNPSVKFASLRAIGNAVSLDFPTDGNAMPEAPISNVASFGYWPFRMFKFVSARVSPDELAFCDCEKEFRSVLEILWQNFQRGLSNFCPKKAARLVDLHPRFCSKTGYFERYLGIWNSNHKAFSFSSTRGQRTGVSIVLPIAESTYLEFVRGRRSNFDIGGDEVLGESSTLIYESIAPFSDSRERPHSLNGTLAFVALNHLSHSLPYVRTNRCEIASFGAHAENIEKMRSVGLRPVGTEIPKLEFPIWQVSNCVDFGLSEEEELRSSTLLHFLSLRQKSCSLKARLSFEAIGALQANRFSQGAERVA